MNSKTIHYIGLDGNSYSEHLENIQVPKLLLHATPDVNIPGIQTHGLKIGMPSTKLMVDIPAIFCTIPSPTPTTADLFRYYPDWSIVIIDTENIPDHVWYIDFLAAEDTSNNGQNRHVMTLEDIPANAIKKIMK